MKRFAGTLALAALAASCTSPAPRAAQTPTQIPSVSPTPLPSPSPSAPPSFDAMRVLAHIRMLAEVIGQREAVSASYRRAADYVARVFASHGYRVVRQAVPVPAGTSQGVVVPAGTSQNVIAYPRGFDPARPHILAGAHLDTVIVSPGANDNASGAALILELARLASLLPTKLPIVFVEFTGEERRQKGSAGALFGSKRYLSSLGRSERASLKAMLNIDMVGNGPVTLVCHGAAGPPRVFLDFVIARARALGLPARESVVTRFFSDHVPFENSRYPVAWLWAGDHPAVHTPNDRAGVVRAADVVRSGRIAWEAIRTFG